MYELLFKIFVGKNSSPFMLEHRQQQSSLFHISKYLDVLAFSPDDGDLMKAYFVYAEERRRSMAEKDGEGQRVERS